MSDKGKLSVFHGDYVWTGENCLKAASEDCKMSPLVKHVEANYLKTQCFVLAKSSSASTQEANCHPSGLLIFDRPDYYKALPTTIYHDNSILNVFYSPTQEFQLIVFLKNGSLQLFDTRTCTKIGETLIDSPLYACKISLKSGWGSMGIFAASASRIYFVTPFIGTNPSFTGQQIDLITKDFTKSDKRKFLRLFDKDSSTFKANEDYALSTQLTAFPLNEFESKFTSFSEMDGVLSVTFEKNPPETKSYTLEFPTIFDQSGRQLKTTEHISKPKYDKSYIDQLNSKADALMKRGIDLQRRESKLLKKGDELIKRAKDAESIGTERIVGLITDFEMLYLRLEEIMKSTE